MADTDPLLKAGRSQSGYNAKPSSAASSRAASAGIPSSLGSSRPRVAPQRSSFTAQKLKLLPQPDSDLIDTEDAELPGPAGGSEASDRSDVYTQIARIKDQTARRDAERLGKAHRRMLPRVTAYCTAGSYRMTDLMRYLSGRQVQGASPLQFDECVYTVYTYARDSDSPTNGGVQRLADDGGEIDASYRRSELFVFEYGVVVMWGFRPEEEQRFLVELARFEKEKLADEDVQIEEFNYYITKSYQPRIYNDFFSLSSHDHMTKLSISHAIAQSVKISLFEELVDSTIDDTQDLPQQVAEEGKIRMSRTDIMKSIGELFILRININLHGSVLDSPELMWAEPQLEPIYQATRGYLEINQRVALLNARLEVISDLLQMLREQLGHVHDEFLEIIVIVLIAAEILVAMVNILVDIYASE